MLKQYHWNIFIFLVPVFLFNFFQLKAQTTATDFNTFDCAGNPHHLFAELDSGKVVILDFVMPCGSCIEPSKTAYNIFRAYEITNPGRILFYLSDGFGSHLCDTLAVWAADNTMDSNIIIISAPDVTLLDYDGLGMPKIVVLGGADHHIYFDENDAAAGDSSGICNAIDSALNANNAVSEYSMNNLSFDFFPNPVLNRARLGYSLEKVSDVIIEIFSVNNEKVFTSFNKNVNVGKHEIEIDFEKIASGNYILKITSNKGSALYQFSVIHE